ncbi:Uncharacterised protein [Bordetella pertussis]|nr:Uncharacterised protein [Bordetella pertussis]
MPYCSAMRMRPSASAGVGEASARTAMKAPSKDADT